MEKRRPAHSLAAIKKQFATSRGLRMTASARNTSFALGLDLNEIVEIVQGTTHQHFYKSMTSHADHARWQDVYHVPYMGMVLYLKFTTDAGRPLLMSLKEK